MRARQGRCAVWTLGYGGVAEARHARWPSATASALSLTPGCDGATLRLPATAAFVARDGRTAQPSAGDRLLGETTADPVLACRRRDASPSTSCWPPMRTSWSRCYPCNIARPARRAVSRPSATAATRPALPAIKTAQPRVLIPVFPGTNCEYDTARAVRAGRRRAGDVGHPQPDRRGHRRVRVEPWPKQINQTPDHHHARRLLRRRRARRLRQVHHRLLPQPRDHRRGARAAQTTGTA